MFYFGKFVLCPGDIIQKLIESGEVTANQVRTELKLTMNQYTELLEGNVTINEDLANKLGKFTGKPSDFWEECEQKYRRSLLQIESSRWRHGQRPLNYYDNLTE